MGSGTLKRFAAEDSCLRTIRESPSTGSYHQFLVFDKGKEKMITRADDRLITPSTQHLIARD